MIQIIQPGAFKLPQPMSFEDSLRISEQVGRVSHRSEESITEDSYKGFILRMVKMEHLSVLEFATVYIRLNLGQVTPFISHLVNHHVPYIKTLKVDQEVYISTNLRCMLEIGRFYGMEFDEVVQFIQGHWYQSVLHDHRELFEVHTSVGVSREGNRHRLLSVLEMSTRYVNFVKDKHGGDIQISLCSLMTNLNDNIEDWRKAFETPSGNWPMDRFVRNIQNCNDDYKYYLSIGQRPQDARYILPLCTASKLYWGAFSTEWPHFLKLRCAPSAHPDIRFIANQIKNQL